MSCTGPKEERAQIRRADLGTLHECVAAGAQKMLVSSGNLTEQALRLAYGFN
jgi:hypothetical protein